MHIIFRNLRAHYGDRRLPDEKKYGNITLCSTSMTKLKKVLSKQKQALRTIPIPTSQPESRYKQIMRELCVLNICQLNIYVLNLMFKVKNGLIPDAFQNKFNMISHDYFTKNSMCNFKEPRFSLKVTKFAISSRGHVSGIKS